MGARHRWRMAVHIEVRRVAGRPRRGTGTAVVAVLLLTAALAACTGSGSGDVRLSVTPSRALYDTPVAVRVSGLDAGQSVALRTASVDAKGTTWKSPAVFRASSTGVVTNAQAPASGSYTGVDPMGLLEDEAP